MSNDITLNCAILGPDLKRITDVSILPNAFVKDLKREIKKARQQDLRHVDTDRIDLWMLYVPLSQKDAIKRFGSKVTLKEEKEIDKLVEELDDLEPLSKYFENSLERTEIHILVEVGNTYSKLWFITHAQFDLPTFGCGILLDVPTSGFPSSMAAAYRPIAELEAGSVPMKNTSTSELRDAHSFWKRWWHSSEPVFVTKLTERDEFPISLVVDKECLVVEGNPFMPPQLHNGMLYRIEYGLLTEYLKATHIITKHGTTIVCGHPGIGKSSYLYVLLATLLKAGETVVFQTEKGSVFLFTEKGPRLVSPTLQNHRDLDQVVPYGTWALIDAGAAFTAPAQMLMAQLHFFVVLASSPRTAHWDGWIKGTYFLEHWFMKPWTLEELIQARSLQVSPPTEKNLEIFFTYYGPSARTAYQVGGRSLGYASQIKTQVADLKPGDILKLFHDANSLNMDRTSHKLFVVYPESNSNRAAHITMPASEKIMHLIYKQDFRNNQLLPSLP